MERQTSQRVREVLEKIAFLPAPQDLVALIIPDASNPFFVQLAFELGRRLRHDNLTLIACSSDDSHSRELMLAGEMRRLRTKAILMCSVGPFGDQAAGLLRDLQIPIFQLDRTFENLPYHSFCFDNVHGANLVAEFLRTRGRRKVIYVGGPTNVRISAIRADAFSAACVARGLALWDAPIGDFSFTSGYVIGKSLISTLRDTAADALFCANDAMAIGALRALHEAGVKVPDDVSLIGYDAIPQGEWSNPPLTSVAQPLSELAEAVANCITDTIAAKFDYRRATVEKIVPRLLERQSA